LVVAVQFDADYFVAIGKRAGALVAIGVLAFLIYFFWSCCRCIGCCKAPVSVKGGTKTFLTILLVALTICAAVFIFFGFGASQKQGSAFEKVPSAVNDILDWTEKLSMLTRTPISVEFGLVHLLLTLLFMDYKQRDLLHPSTLMRRQLLQKPTNARNHHRRLRH
jgi:hypothetical protein